MKKVLAVVLVVVFAFCASALGGADVKASLLRYDPAPAEQGNVFDVWVQLSNVGTKADQVSLKFVPVYPFSVPEGQNEEVDVGVIAAREVKVVKFSVYVDDSAPNGNKDLRFLYKFSSKNEWVQFEAPVALETQNAVVVIDEYEVKPSPVIPGQMAVVELGLRNAGKVDVKNVDVTIDLHESKFSTMRSGTKKRVDFIRAGETKKVSFQLASDTSTEVKLYNVPLSLSYQDERNRQYQDSAKVSLMVNAPPDLVVSVASTKFDKKNKPGTVSLKIVNKGITNVKYVYVHLLGGSYELLSPSNAEYVGNLDSDDFETVDFVIRPLVQEPVLRVQVDFKDPYNVDTSKVYELKLRIITDADLEQGNSVVGWIIAGLILLGGVVYWKYGRKNHPSRKGGFL